MIFTQSRKFSSSEGFDFIRKFFHKKCVQIETFMIYLLRLSCVLHFSVYCLCDTYLTGFCIQKQIRTSLGNLVKFSERISSCFCQSLSYFSRQSEITCSCNLQSIKLKIYRKKLSRFSQNYLLLTFQSQVYYCTQPERFTQQ